jgi:PAS domain S-box-containing protein
MDRNHRADHAPVHLTGAGSTGGADGSAGLQEIAVLYVDDEPALLEPTRISLEKKKGFIVDTTTSAQDALEKVAARHYDVIVSDYQMPDMDGIQLLRKLREDKNDIPFIIFTGKGREDAVIEAYDAGADFYLAKGGRPRAMFLDLANKIRQAVTRKRAEKALRESEERYRKVIEQSHDAIYIHQGPKFVFVNDRVSEMSGYSKDELYGMNILDLVHPDDREQIGEIARRRMSGEAAPRTYEARILTRKGEVRYLEFSVTSLEFNGMEATQGSVRDITDRRIAEDALRKSEEKFRSIFNTFDDLYYQTDMQGIITILSPSCKKITGWDASELIGHQVVEMYPFPEQRKILLGEMFTNGAVHDYEVILKNKEGKHLNVSVTSHVIRDANGNPLGVEGSLRDITGRKQVEEALHASEERYRTLADLLPVIVFETNTSGILTFANRLTYSAFGIDTADVMSGISVTDYIVPGQQKTAKENMVSVFSGESRSSVEYTLQRKNGSRFPAMISTSPIIDRKTGEVSGLRGVIIDLTELKTKDAALQQSEESYHGLFNTVKDAICILDEGGTFIDVNRGAEEMFGHPHEFFIGKTFEALSAPGRNDLARAFGQVHDAFLGRPQQLEFWGSHNGGGEFLTEVRLYKGTYFGKDAVIFLSVDISERRKAETALRESEELFRALFNNANDAIFLHEILPGAEPGRYLMVNDIACTRLGYTREELLSMSPFDIVSPSHARNIPAISQMIRHRGHATFDAIHRKKDGTEFPVEISAHLFELHGRQLSLSIARDVTERKRMEEALRSSEQTLHAIIDGSSIPLFVINRDHEVLYWNKALEKYSGVPAKEILGTSMTWKAFYTEKRPVLADLLIDNEIEKIPSWYAGTFSPSPYIEGAFEATDFFPKIGAAGTWLHFSAIAIKDAEGGVIGALELLEDVTDRKKAEEELRSSEQYLKTIFNSVQTGLVIIDPGTSTIIDVNPAAVGLIGAGREEIVGAGCGNFICHTVNGKCPVDDVHLQRDNIESILTRADGQKVPILKTVIPVTISGKPALLESILDITDRKRAEDAMQRAYFELEQKVEDRTKELSNLTENLQNEVDERKRVMDALAASEEKYRSLVEQIGDIVFHIDENGFITYMSPHVLAQMGIVPEQFQKINALELIPREYHEALRELLDPAVTEHSRVAGFEIRVPKAGTVSLLVLEVNATPSHDRTGRFTGYSGIARDITERKNLEDEIAASLNEKEILLKEIHHRVKNNMQVISSLLSLQARQMKDAGSREAIRESQNRVMSIALVHEKLYQSKNLSRIHYDDYLKIIGENLLQSYGIPAGKVILDIRADAMVLPISKAIPVSLIINELVSNSLKYAFPQERTGTISIDFRRAGRHHTLIVKDDGVGLPVKIVLETIETLGLQLVNSLVAQIQGTLSLHRENGTEYRIAFDVEPEEGEHYG